MPFRQAQQAAAAHPIFGSRLVISTALHLVVAAIALSLYQAQPPREPRSVIRTPAKLVAVIHMPPTLPEILPLPPVPPAPVAKAEPLVVEVPRAPEPAPPKPIESRVAEVTPVREPVIPQPRPAPEPKPAPSVVVGAFANNAATAVRAPEPARQVESVAFEAPAARGVEAKPAQVATAGFDRAATETRATPTGGVATTGFDRAPATPQAPRASGAVRETGFGNTEARARQAEPARAIAPTGFDDAPKAQAAPKPAPAAPPAVTPVEVLSKPVPAYTDEARKQRIEGEVVLDVEFGANGSVRVLGVVRGLGHGLDESAVRAAQQIQFKPAREGTRTVDFRTTVHIVFRLA